MQLTKLDRLVLSSKLVDSTTKKYISAGGPETAATAGEAHRARFEQAERFDGKNSARKEIIYGSDGEKDDEDRP